MSEEKVLTLRGKKAVWAPAPAGVGGGVQVVTMDINTGMASHTGAEITEMALKSPVRFINGDPNDLTAVMTYGGTTADLNETYSEVLGTYATFMSFIMSNGGAMLTNIVLIPFDGKSITFRQLAHNY